MLLDTSALQVPHQTMAPPRFGDMDRVHLDKLQNGRKDISLFVNLVTKVLVHCPWSPTPLPPFRKATLKFSRKIADLCCNVLAYVS